MNSNQQWGRKETIVWPPHAPIYTLTALAFGIFATLFFVWQFLRFTETPLSRTYTSTYIQSLVGATFKQHGKYRLLYLGGGKAAPRLAFPADFVPGETRLPNGAVFPVALSEAMRHQGYTVFYRGPEKDYNDVALSRWLRSVYFDGQGLLDIYATALGEGLLVLVIALAFAGRADVKRFRELKYGRHLKGPIMVSPAQFNRALQADGLAIETSRKPWYLRKPIQLRIPKRAEAKHIHLGRHRHGQIYAHKTAPPASRRPRRNRHRL